MDGTERMRGIVGPSSLLAQRAAWEGPRWTRAVEDNPTIPREDFPNPSFVGWKREIKRGENREGVSGMVHELWVGLIHFSVNGAGGCIGLSPGRIALALADGGAGAGRDRNCCGDFMD